MNATTDHNHVEDAVIKSESVTGVENTSSATESEVVEIENTPLAISTMSKVSFDDALKFLQAQAKDAATLDVSTPDGMARAKQLRGFCVKTRGAAEEAYTKWNKPHLDQAKRNRDIRDAFLVDVGVIEKPIKAAIEAQEEIAKERKREKDRIEAERIQGHRVALANLQAFPDAYIKAGADEISAQLDDLLDPNYLKRRDWQEFDVAAADALVTVIEKMQGHHDNAVQRAELAALQAKQRQEEEARQHAEAERVKEQQRLAGLRDGIDAIKGTVQMCVGMGADFIAQQIDSLTQDASEDYAELQAEADQARAAAVDALRELHAQAVKKEADDKEMAELRAMRDRMQAEALAKEKAELKAREDAERAEQEARDRAEAERLAKEKAEREAREAEERERAAAEAARLQRVQAQAVALLDMLKRIVSEARELGCSAAVISEAESMISSIEGSAQ